MIEFGTGGFRTIIGEGFTKESVQKIAQAICNIIIEERLKKEIALGFDQRFLSKESSVWISEVFAGNNIKVNLTNKVVPTPSIMFAVKNLELDFGLMITASHNPYLYNGIKVFMKGGRDALEELNLKIGQIASSLTNVKTIDFEEAMALGLVCYFDPIPNYIQNLSNFINPTFKESSAKILFNNMYGVATESVNLLKEKYNLLNLELINTNHDAFFNFELPAPNAETLQAFSKQVVCGNYNFGLAVDADADRIALIDEKGTFYDGNIIIPLVHYYLAKYRNLKGDVVKNIATSIFADKMANALGVNCHEVFVGFKFLVDKMNETNAILLGEGSGGVTLNGYISGKDGIFSSMILIELQKIINKPMSVIIDEAKNFCGYSYALDEMYFEIKNKNNIINILNSRIPNFNKEVVSVQKEDGFKYVFKDNTWLLIRFSKNEPVLRIHTEQTTQKEAEDFKLSTKKFIEEIDC